MIKVLIFKIKQWYEQALEDYEESRITKEDKLQEVQKTFYSKLPKWCENQRTLQRVWKKEAHKKAKEDEKV